MYNFDIKDRILYEDKEILVCHKPAGIAVQNARIGTMDLESMLKNYLSIRNPDKVPYLAVIHRLDQPVEGVLVFALTQKSAATLSRQIGSKEASKIYLAVTDHEPEISEGNLEDWMIKEARGNKSAVVPERTKGAKKARLSYKVQKVIADERTETGKRVFVEIRLETGRHHQIRVQMANAGMPLLGDRKYNPEDTSGLPLGLCAQSLTFRHPGSGKTMEFQVEPESRAFQLQ